MGQRTGIIVKRNFASGGSDVRKIYHQWGIGKTMPAYFIQELLRCSYPIERSVKLDPNHGIGYADDFSFKGLNPVSVSSVITSLDESKIDVWDKSVVKDILYSMDNNNGGMVVEITEKMVAEYGITKYPIVTGIKIGFLLGSEECYEWDEEKRKAIKKEEPFERFVSMREYMLKTGEEYCPENIIKSFELMLEYFEVEQVVD